MPEERRMTITSSPHLAPDEVARHTFASVRRGFDPGEVRDYLESIAAGLRAWPSGSTSSSRSWPKPSTGRPIRCSTSRR